MISQFMIGLVSGAAFLLPSLILDRGGTPAQVGLVYAIIPSLILIAPLLGGLLDRFHTFRLFHAIGLLSVAGGVAILGFSYSLPAWIGGAILTAIGLPLIWITNLTLVMGGGFSEEEAAKRIGWVQFLFTLGQAIILLFVSVLFARGTPYEVMYSLFAAIAAGGFIVTTATNRAAARRATEVAKSSRAQRVAEASAAKAGGARRKGGFTIPFVVFLASTFLTFFGFSSFDSQFPVYLETVFGVMISVSSLVTAIALLIALAIYPVAAIWVARSGARPPFLANLGVRALAAAGIVAVSAVGENPQGTLPLFLYSTVMLVWPLMDVSSPMLASQTTTLSTGLAQGAYTAAAGVGIIVGPLVGGLIAQALGYPALPIAFLIGNAIAFVIAFFGLRVRRPAAPAPTAAAA